ncbi:hypothetical protein [Rhizobium laguerreae]|uniref:hypothetical protein n=1 Tax=Rhizobium laguerreae TaxID=1076926 RepID=UPI001C8FAF54|nr:hypothetical protein [Rhizobium laguerreae]MBY3434796.1 hypothetical protein [Rhizobium laguerreae]MBY3448939.1 hypothetical protein [Rhizobium laguerreae]MBY3456713.1 hypothetical protein [Rhizobium laguerreae]
MTHAITLWLAFVLAAGAIAWFGTKRQALAFLLVALATAPAAFLTLGHAAPWQPANGHYTVLGARIDVDEAIYVLLDAPGEPRLYKLPYSAQQASELQNSLDTAEANGTGVGLTMDGDAAGFAEEGQRGGSEVKQAEPQAIIGG